MLQDEVDYLREKADQATRLQAAVDSFKKKLEDMKTIKDRVFLKKIFKKLLKIFFNYLINLNRFPNLKKTSKKSAWLRKTSSDALKVIKVKIKRSNNN